MDAKAEAKAAESAAKHAAEFRRKHNISQEEWDLAEAMHKAMITKMRADFWEKENQS